MNSLKSQIESILFVSNHPLTLKKLADTIGATGSEIKQAVSELAEDYKKRGQRGIFFVQSGQRVQLMTNGENAKTVKKFIKDETSGELTKAQLETLTIIAYRGPVSRAEIEQIRGVNCSIILKNLMIRGLIENINDKKSLTLRYNVTLEFLRFLGVESISELPDYKKLHSLDTLQQYLETPSE